MKCTAQTCNKEVTPFIVEKEYAINPQVCDIGDLRSLFGFFQYTAPNTTSYQCENLESLYHEGLYNEMLRSWKQDVYKIIESNEPFDKKASQYVLTGDSVCSYCKRFVCKRKKTKKGQKESDFDCLMRHIRNSLAHGRVFVIHGGNSIKVMFEDYDMNNKVVSARIVCNQSDLRKWRTLVKKYIKKQRETTCHN